MATCKPVGIDNFIKDMDVRSKSFKDMAGRSLYVGADIIADKFRENIKALPERSKSAKQGAPLRGVTPEQKQAMLDHMGIARMQNLDGTYDIKIGFEGYDNDKTKKYPNGHPISMIARSVESGTSFLQKTPFIRTTYQQAHAQAEAAMAETLEREWSKGQ